MNYCAVDKETEEHLLKLIDFLCKEVSNAGGDGDALWYSKYYDVKDILRIVESYNKKFEKSFWNVNFDGKSIYYGEGQEGLLITNDEEIYKNHPSWQQIVVKY